MQGFIKSVSNAATSQASKAVSSALTNSQSQVTKALTDSKVGKSVTSTLTTGVTGSIVKTLVPATRDGDIIQSLISKVYEFIAAHLPFEWGLSPEEESAQDNSFSQFSAYMAQLKPHIIYEKELQQLDTIGVIDLGRLTREQWPKKETSYFALLSINTYEKETYALNVQTLTDAISIAQIYKSRGFRVTYLFNTSAKEFYKWLDFFVQNVKREVTVYFAGVATNVVSNGNITQVLAFRGEAKKVDGTIEGAAKPTPTPITATVGVTTNTISEDQLLDIVSRTAKSALRTVFIHNVVNNVSAFTPDEKCPLLVGGGGNAGSAAAGHIVPPHKCVYVQINSESAAAQHAFAVRLQQQLAAVSAYSFAQLKAQPPTQAVALSPNGGVTVVANTDPLLTEAVIFPIPPGDEEMQLEEILAQMLGSNLDPSKIPGLPDPNNLTQAEIEGAEQRWCLFTQEMKNSPNYTSKYRSTLQKLDSLGCMNLQRLDRANIPNIRIDRCAALFFNPYEGLEHTLDLGPVNDGLTMANLYLSKGYKIVYLMDSTPKEFYSWMDWLLSNIRGEIVVYFSGHGTQAKDTTGKEADGKMELLVFFNDSKKSTKLPKITPQSGITDMTVSDDCLHQLIMLKDYPDTRVVLISDCCHSGTMYNFDQPVSIAPNRPPLNVVCVGAAKDAQTAKQTVLGGKESGVFTYSLETVVKQNDKATFADLETYTRKNIKKYQDINITTTNLALFGTPIIMAPKLSSDPTSRNYSPAVATEAQLKSRALTHKTAIPPGGVRVRRERPIMGGAAAAAAAAAASPSSALPKSPTATTTTTAAAAAASRPQKTVTAARAAPQKELLAKEIPAPAKRK